MDFRRSTTHSCHISASVLLTAGETSKTSVASAQAGHERVRSYVLQPQPIRSLYVSSSLLFFIHRK
jgi:hypothetical protein